MNVAIDKRYHFLAGFAIACIGSGFAYLLNLSYPFLYGFFAGIIAGISKEFYDFLNPKNHTCEMLDAIYTWAGTILSTLIFVWWLA